ncbi:MAG: 50S ribosomal protein L4 [Nitrospirae bacterium]|nr:50S ribosomal protein L4 [Nitrospirota bacterium]
MPQIRVVDIQNKEVGNLRLSENVFAVPVNKALLHEVVVMQRNNERQGTVATKTKGLVSGGGKKPWKQKGTGRARSGSSRSPVWRGGGTIFGPLPRDYAYRLPKQKIQAALRSALSSRLEEGRLVVLEKFDLAVPKTREAVQVFKNLGFVEDVLLVVTGTERESILRGVNNIPWVTVLPVEALNVYDVLRCRQLVMTRDAVHAFQGEGS